MKSQQVHRIIVYLKSVGTLWFTWLTTKWKCRKLSLYFPQVLPTKEPPTMISDPATRHRCRSKVSRSSPHRPTVRVTTRRSWKFFPYQELPRNQQEFAHNSPTESDQRQRVWPSHCAKSLTHVHPCLRTCVRTYVRKQVCRYVGT